MSDGSGLCKYVECCFTSTETEGLLGKGAQDGHLDFHTPPELSTNMLGWAYTVLLYYMFFLYFFLNYDLKREKEQVPLPCPFSSFLQGTGGGSSGSSSSIFTTEISTSIFTTDVFHASVESDILLVLVSRLELQPV